MKKLVIDRQRWLRGEGGSESKLQRSKDGCRCCLGFYCLQLAGYTEEQIMDQSSPEMLEDAEKHEALSELLFFRESNEEEYQDSALCLNLIGTNDAPELLSNVREKEITRMFSIIGVEVEFIN